MTRIGLAFALILTCSTTAGAQFAALNWEFDNTCGSGVLADELMSITGCDDSSSSETFFRSVAPYPGTAYVRVDFTNHDVFWGVDWVAWEIDGVPSQLEHNYQYWLGSLAFDVPGDTSFGLGITTFDAQFGPGSEDLTEFHFFPDGVTQRHELAEDSADFGTALASTPDANGDGVPDVLVGAPLAAAGRGRVLLLSGADGAVLLDLLGPAENGAFGSAVDALADLDGDMIPELLVGSPNESTTGVARVLSGVDGSVLFSFGGDAPFDAFGSSVAGLGDADGDGLEDFAVGAPLNDAAGNKAGLVRVFSGADGSLLRQVTGNAARDELGTHVACVGDADGDTLADLLLGTPAAEAGGINRGQVSVISVATGALVRQWSGDVDLEGLGASVAGPGDLDGDGLGDVLFGSPSDDLNQARVHSTGDGSLIHAWELTDWLDQGAYTGLLSSTSTTRFATHVAAAGDLDDDGVPDVLIRGTQRDYLSQSSFDPQVFVFAFSGRDGSLLEVFTGPRGDSRYGEAFCTAQDLDGDGRSDVLIGHPGTNPVLDAVETITTKIAWADLGFALPGTNGAPHLKGIGLLAEGTPLQLSLEDAAAGAPTFLVVGLAALNLPFEGGVLVPAFSPPMGVIRSFGITDGAGSTSISTTWPVGIPAGTSLWIQSWILDAQGVFGLAASNALRATVP